MSELLVVSVSPLVLRDRLSEQKQMEFICYLSCRKQIGCQILKKTICFIYQFTGQYIQYRYDSQKE